MRVAAFDTRGVGRAFRQPTSYKLPFPDMKVPACAAWAGGVPPIGFAGLADATIASRFHLMGADHSRQLEQRESGMRTAGYRVALLLAAVLAGGSASLTPGAASAQQQAVKATVTGDKIQKVGFRAMIQKEAIMYNLAGSARNNPDGTVEVSLQGDKDRIDKTLAAIRTGSKKSSHNNTISQVPAAWDPNLKTFTVFDWTSTSRNIMHPYNLIFTVRPANDEISHDDAKVIWNNIAESILKGDDLTKFLKHLHDDDD
jgi:acylphosphatase